ncbi:MAG: S-adenosylmethionine decarboxylase [Candidatus Bathyarchaeota archaeon]|nr:S-adenosylmethionine decarboxylase [Candidatus Bathyarchaeota archaeon]
MNEVVWDVRKKFAYLESDSMNKIEAILKESGHHILREAYYVFPNGAVTRVYILAESHFVYHTWPETDMIYFDLFSCKNGGRKEFLDIVEKITNAIGEDGEIVRISFFERFNEGSIRPDISVSKGNPR